MIIKKYKHLKLKDYFNKGFEFFTDILVTSKIFKGQKEYTKFVVLGYYRTGSNFLVSSLQSHPNLLLYSELYLGSKISWGPYIYGGRRNNSKTLDFRNNNPVKFADKYLFRPYSKKIRMVGLKVMYPHLKDERFEALPNYFRSDDIRIIHLTRENLLESFMSNLILQKHNRASEVEVRGKPKVEKFTVKYEACLTFFDSMIAYQDKYRAFYPNCLNITYENLVGDYAETMKKVLSFLNAEQKSLKTPLVKQNRVKMSEMIENYEDLKTKFQNTKYSVYFND